MNLLPKERGYLEEVPMLMASPKREIGTPRNGTTLGAQEVARRRIPIGKLGFATKSPQMVREN